MSYRFANLFVTHQQTDRSQLPALLAAASADTGTPSYVINLALDRPEIAEYSIDALSTNWNERTFSGRLFGTNAELKWQQNHGDRFDVWTLKESAEGLDFVAEDDLRFYCIGTWNPSDQCFRDGRLPQKLTYYPKRGSCKDDRFFFRVAAYRPSMSTDGASLDEIVNVLNRPRIAAYRLTGVGVDSGMPNIKYDREVNLHAE